MTVRSSVVLLSLFGAAALVALLVSLFVGGQAAPPDAVVETPGTALSGPVHILRPDGGIRRAHPDRVGALRPKLGEPEPMTAVGR